MKSIFVLALLSLLAGCASAGTSFEWDNARKVSVGMSEAELVALMGKPNSVATTGDSQQWTWIHVTAGLGGTSSRRVSFGLKNGRVSAVPNLAQFN